MAKMSEKRFMGYGALLFTLLGFVVIGFLSIQIHGSGVSVLRAPRAHTVTAVFENVGGLKVGSPVKIAGVKVGEVTAVNHTAAKGYKAVVTLTLETRFGAIPVDSMAAIQTASLLGGNFISISPGSGAALSDPGEIDTASSPFSVERVIAHMACGNSTGECTKNGH
jgi:phospholipid/cholesterol/gamma-HCH transport system substrate-binding protein